MEKLFEKYRKRLKVIGMLKALILSLAISFILMGICSIVTLIIRTEISITLCLTFGIGIISFGFLFYILYERCFKPTTKSVAKELDLLGQEERYITMYEFNDSNLSMAKFQRDDAKKKLSNISEKSLKFKIALPVIFLLVFGIIFAAGTTTASVLVYANSSKQPSMEIVDSIDETPEKFIITYKVFTEGTGEIDGEAIQEVEEGGFTKQVTAVPALGYRFVAWVDEDLNFLLNQNNPRFEVNIHGNMTIFAFFEKITVSSEEENTNSDKEDESGKPEIDQGEDEGSQSDDNGKGESGDGNSEDGDGEERENNKVIDGTKDYRENFDRERLEKELLGKDIPDELKDILGDYYNTLKP